MSKLLHFSDVNVAKLQSSILSLLHQGHFDPPCAKGLVPNTVSFATRAASSVSMAICIIQANISLSLFTLNRAFGTASLLTEKIKRVRRASSRESLIDGKSHVLASCQLLNCLAGSVFHLTPELELFTNYKTVRIKLVCHECLDFLHRQIVDLP